jgi:hypothetical protein
MSKEDTDGVEEFRVRLVCTLTISASLISEMSC